MTIYLAKVVIVGIPYLPVRTYFANQTVVAISDFTVCINCSKCTVIAISYCLSLDIDQAQNRHHQYE